MSKPPRYPVCKPPRYPVLYKPQKISAQTRLFTCSSRLYQFWLFWLILVKFVNTCQVRCKLVEFGRVWSSLHQVCHPYSGSDVLGFKFLKLEGNSSIILSVVSYLQILSRAYVNHSLGSTPAALQLAIKEYIIAALTADPADPQNRQFLRPYVGNKIMLASQYTILIKIYLYFSMPTYF